jgi:hypothetical protein
LAGSGLNVSSSVTTQFTGVAVVMPIRAIRYVARAANVAAAKIESGVGAPNTAAAQVAVAASAARDRGSHGAGTQGITAMRGSGSLPLSHGEILFRCNKIPSQNAVGQDVQ